MKNIYFEKLVRWTNGSRAGSFQNPLVTGISTDTRTIKPGEVYLPLKGEKFDGHDFIKNALDKGASGFITSRDIPPDFQDYPAIKVKDTLEAYHDVARNYLKTLDVKVITITGSNGKTTTKDIIYHLLSDKFKTVATEKNFNNEIGVPKTILNLGSDDEILVVELAMRGPGQIGQLARIVRPDIAVITNVGESHFEFLGSYEAIASAKCEIFEPMNPQGTSILNADDKWFEFCARRSPAKVVTFGVENPADVQLVEKQELTLAGYNLELKIPSINDERSATRISFRIPLLGIHNVYNCLAASAAVLCVGLQPDELANRMETLKYPDKRMEMLRSPGGWIVINDTYNASPTSTRRALEIVRDLPTEGRKIAVLGDMLELGDIEVQAHRQVGAFAAQSGIDQLHVLGQLGMQIAEGAKEAGLNNGRIGRWVDKTSLKTYLKRELKPEDLVLVKGSRKMKMEEISYALVE